MAFADPLHLRGAYGFGELSEVFYTGRQIASITSNHGYVIPGHQTFDDTCVQSLSGDAGWRRIGGGARREEHREQQAVGE